MKKTLTLLFIFNLLLGLVACISGDSVSILNRINFTDSLNNELTVDKNASLVCLDESSATLAVKTNNKLVGATSDYASSTYFKGVDCGDFKDPSTENVISSNADIVFMVSTLSSHLKIGKALEDAGIMVAYFSMNSFSEYLDMLKIFTNISGETTLYKILGTDKAFKINKIIKESDFNYNILLLRASSFNVKVKTSDNLAGKMLCDIGTTNIADNDSSLEDLSLEYIVTNNPDYIFVTTMGDVDKATSYLLDHFENNEAWDGLDAVKHNHFFILDKVLFQNKPLDRWYESYETLYQYFIQ